MNMTDIVFKKESFKDTFEEALPLVCRHYEEIAHFKDIPLEPDTTLYQQLEDSGLTRVFTVRKNNALIGYSLFFVRPNPHYKSSLQAVQDVIFIDKEHRGIGRKFISWCDEQLRSESVQVVYHHVKTQHNFGPVLERNGYELIDLIYGKRLI